jgi:hypothetical protein
MFSAHNWPAHALKTVLRRMSQRIKIPLSVECRLVCNVLSLQFNKMRVCCYAKPFLNFTVCSAICMESNLKKIVWEKCDIWFKY